MNLIAGTGTQRAAKTSRVQVSSTNLAFASWEANVTSADLVTVNFESYNAGDNETYDEGLHGVLACAMRYGGMYDASANPFVNPPGLYVRDDLSSLSFVTSRTDGTAWSFPYSRIRGVTNSGAVDGLVLFNVTDSKNQGRFTAPGGGIA